MSNETQLAFCIEIKNGDRWVKTMRPESNEHTRIRRQTFFAPNASVASLSLKRNVGGPATI